MGVTRSNRPVPRRALTARPSRALLRARARAHTATALFPKTKSKRDGRRPRLRPPAPRRRAPRASQAREEDPQSLQGDVRGPRCEHRAQDRERRGGGPLRRLPPRRSLLRGQHPDHPQEDQVRVSTRHRRGPARPAARFNLPPRPARTGGSRYSLCVIHAPGCRADRAFAARFPPAGPSPSARSRWAPTTPSSARR